MNHVVDLLTPQLLLVVLIVPTHVATIGCVGLMLLIDSVADVLRFSLSSDRLS